MTTQKDKVTTISRTFIYTKQDNKEKKLYLNSEMYPHSKKREFKAEYTTPLHRKSLEGIHYNDDKEWNIKESKNDIQHQYKKPNTEFQNWFQHNQQPRFVLEPHDKLHHSIIESPNVRWKDPFQHPFFKNEFE